MLPVAYFVPRGNAVDEPWVRCEGYPLPIVHDTPGQLPRAFGSKKYDATGNAGYIVRREFEHTRNSDDSLSVGGVSGDNFLRRDCRLDRP